MNNIQSLIIVLAVGLSILFLGCSKSFEEKMAEDEMADSTSNAFNSSSAAVESGVDSNRLFVRTADLKFKVKSVFKSTDDIENITNRQGGFVTYTNLTSDINNVTAIAVSADSTLETTYFTVTNTIVIRVPNTKLDTTLKEISKNIDYLDYRIIKAEDVGLQILSNDLTQKRSAKNQERLTKAIDQKVSKLSETTNVEELLLDKQEQSDNAKISNLSLADQIRFSTINIFIYQRPTLRRELISNDKNVDVYELNFGSKILESFKYGWDIIETLFVFLTKLWGLFLIAIIVYLLYNKYRYKIK